MNKKTKILIILSALSLAILYTIYIIPHFSKAYKDKVKFINEIKKIFQAYNKVNINEIEHKINNKKDLHSKKIESIINIGFTLDKDYILETMLTIASIMATQNKTTKVRFHFGVTKRFTPEKMIKMYELRNKINNLTEFNFYYLKDSIAKMKKFHPKGEACPGKFELPMLLSNDIERLIIFDAGDLLVLRDLTELYNYNMGDYWVLGTPEPSIIDSFMKKRYNITKYINIGSILLDVKKFKMFNFWLNFTNNRFLTLEGQPDQTLFNILVPDNKKNFLPFKFGGFSLFRDDKKYDSMSFEKFGFKDWLNSFDSKSLPEKPNSEEGIILKLYNPRFIHQFNGKWENGEGLSIYRLLAKYFILLAGISKEICKKKPGYCI